MPKLRIRCEDCERWYTCNEKNTILHLFKKRMYCSFMESFCPECDDETRGFTDEETLSYILQKGWPIKPYDDPPEALVKEWERASGITLLTYKELTPRQETYIKFFAWLMNRGDQE